MFLAVSKNADDKNLEEVQTSIQSKIREFDTPSYNKMKEAKKLKKILKEVHEDYFTKYEELTYFDDVFTTGLFNCVSASALYAIIFEGLNIPYSIKISLNHVFLIAYPSTNSIMIETTNPIAGYYVYDKQFKENYVEYLKTIKLISEEEFKNKSTEELFDKNFYREKDISLQELVGILYTNKGLVYMTDEKYEEAFKIFEKAYFLYPSEQIGYYLLISNAVTLNECDYMDIKYADFLAKFCRYEKLGITDENIIAEFSDLTYKILTNNSNPDLYDAYFKKLNPVIKDSALSAEIGYIYYYERGRFLFNKFKYTESLPFIENAYKIKPKNADAENLFLSNLILTFSESDSPQDVLTHLNYYADNFPFLKENNQFAILRYLSILSLCEMNFSMRNSEKAFEYLSMFENSLPENKDEVEFNMIKQNIVSAYSSAASYYFRRGNYSRAKIYLEKGLEFVPGNYELTKKLRALK